MSSLKVCQLAKFVGKIRWCCSMLTFVAKESELEIISLPCLQSVQLAAGSSEVVVSDDERERVFICHKKIKHKHTKMMMRTPVEQQSSSLTEVA